MGLKSIFQRKPGRAAAPPADAPADLMQQARLRARRRLIGAVVLVVIGVIGFPLLFETQPRPIPVDIPIVIPRKDNVPPLAMPAPRRTTPMAAAPVEPSASSLTAEDPMETSAEAGREMPAPKAARATPEKGEPAPRAAEAVSKPDASKPVMALTEKPSAPTPQGGVDARRAQAPTDGKVADKTPVEREGRYVVQVGAFAESAAAREVRQKLEKLGLKTYVQVTETAQGNRVRVRVGPFATRDEADRALARIKSSGAAAVVVTL